MRIACFLRSVLVVFFAPMLLSGCLDDGAERKTPAVTPVIGMKVETRKVMIQTDLSGRINAYRKAEVRPQVTGIIQRRLFEEGALVTEGEQLYQIDPSTYEAAFRSAQGALAKAQAKLISARHRAERYAKLVSSNAVSRQEMEDAKAEHQQAVADVAVCKAALHTAKIDLDHTQVHAPISGRIGRSSVTVGALVTANQAAELAVIQQTDPMYVDVTQSSMSLMSLRERLESGRMTDSGPARAEVTLRLENDLEYPLKGVLRFTDISVDESTGMVTLRAVFPNPQRKLLPGMYARLILNEGFDDKALPVPQRAVMRDPKGQASVFVLTADSKAERRNVTALEQVGRCWNVSSGLKAGDIVIVEGFQRLHNGSGIAVKSMRTIDDFLKD